MQDQIYYAGEGDDDLHNVFEGPWRGFAPIRTIFLTQGSHHVLELEGVLEVNWFNPPCCEGISRTQAFAVFLVKAAPLLWSSSHQWDSVT